MGGQRSNSHSIGSPFTVAIEIVTRRGEQTKFVVGGEMEFLIYQREIIHRRTRVVHFSKTEDHRTMVQRLMVIDEKRIQTGIREI